MCDVRPVPFSQFFIIFRVRATTTRPSDRIGVSGECDATCGERRRRRRVNSSRQHDWHETASSNDHSPAQQPQQQQPRRSSRIRPPHPRRCARTGRGCHCSCRPVDRDRAALALPSWRRLLRKCARTCGDDRRGWQTRRNEQPAVTVGQAQTHTQTQPPPQQQQLPAPTVLPLRWHPRIRPRPLSVRLRPVVPPLIRCTATDRS